MGNYSVGPGGGCDADIDCGNGTNDGSQCQTNTNYTCTNPSGGGGQQQGAGGDTALINPLGANSNLSTLVSSILSFVVQIGSVVVILMMVFVGYKFVTAQGEPGKITEARNALLYTLVGALILLGAQAIATGIQSTVSALTNGNTSSQ